MGKGQPGGGGGMRCQYCGSRCNLVLDHVVPKSQGGKTTWGNMVYACKDCNAKKGSRTPKQAGMTLHGSPIRKKDTMRKTRKKKTTRRSTTARKTTRKRTTKRTTATATAAKVRTAKKAVRSAEHALKRAVKALG